MAVFDPVPDRPKVPAPRPTPADLLGRIPSEDFRHEVEGRCERGPWRSGGELGPRQQNVVWAVLEQLIDEVHRLGTAITDLDARLARLEAGRPPDTAGDNLIEVPNHP